MRRARLTVSIMVAAAIAAAQGGAVQAADVDASWLKGAFILPESLAARVGSPKTRIARIDLFKKELAAVTTEEKTPIAIVLHGCGGIITEQAVMAKHLADIGFSVFLPSHEARSDARVLCAAAADGTPFFASFDAATLQQRLDEFAHALVEAGKLGFTDPSRVLAAGHSQGGLTVGHLGRDDITAAIITGWGCEPPWASQSPRAVPQLAVRHKDDPWLKPGWYCEVRLFGGRDGSNTVSVVLDGERAHSVMHNERAVSAITGFARRHFLSGP
jgi:dienelactone hydrolase